ncbi:MAG: hypothetical protein UT13_C0001G0017 [Candidatus Pacebacteria bacterium GW2011_GWF2_38_9]|nr:MAG: hypothetical protein US01_C0001G0017 [candidate division TM6 bacterium GW2011_GWF2_28_16]KKQ88371.1 MAG: hypothetical protein UT13_C0001G0017 [Candidatus Pacebacteria bacterium GW2011_GWF2_38_9]HAZ72988.1 hypothetical protein [Candidatus Paceibacterota bacterium]
MDKIYSSIKLNFKQRKQNIALLSLGLLLLFMSIWLIAVYNNYYQDRFYPKTFIEDLNVSGLKVDEAKTKIQEKMSEKVDFENDFLTIYYLDKNIQSSLRDLEIKNNLDDVLTEAFAMGHQKNILKKYGQIIKGHLYSNKYSLGLSYDQEKIQLLIEKLKEQVDSAGEKPSVFLVYGKVEISEGQDSDKLLIDETWQKLHQQILAKDLRNLNKEDLQIEAVVEHPILALNQLQLEMSKSRAEKLLNQQLTFGYEYQKIVITDKELMSFLALPEGFDEVVMNGFLEVLKNQINRPSSDASFIYDKDTLEVTEFVPDKNGLEIDVSFTKETIKNFLSELENGTNIQNSFDLPMQSLPAQITLAKTNDLGITEVIGFGESWYAHSIPNRIYNVTLTADRISNHIVKPGEEFSFNKALGEVSDKTGFRNAYIIEAGETKLAPGGGVCQVSSTLFRSLLDAGLKITRRLPHAYRVSYYEIGNEPGFDATVYSGDTDLRFINDTNAHILINCQSDSENLYMFCKIYGTSDGRYNEIVKYKKWGQTSALPTVYIPDPSLAPGQLKQIDWSASGIKAEFTNVVYDKNGQIMHEDYYYSSYRSWAAKYLQGV